MAHELTRGQSTGLGLAVVVGVGLIAGLVWLLAGHRLFRDRFHVWAECDNAEGVNTGTRVRIRGIDAGMVVERKPPPSPEAPILLRLEIDADYRDLIRRDASVQIVAVGFMGKKEIEITPGTDAAEVIGETTTLKIKPGSDLAAVARKADQTLDNLNRTLAAVVEGDGTFGKLIRDPSAHDALLDLLKQTKYTMVAVQQDAEAVKKIPFLGGLVEDPQALLVRPDFERNRRYFREAELFEPGRAALTAGGKTRLDELGGWVEGMKHRGSHVVVVSYADPAHPDPVRAKTVTAAQSKAVLDYLKDEHKIQKVDWASWRKATALGMGVNPPPVPDRLPFPRVEVLVFVPHN